MKEEDRTYISGLISGFSLGVAVTVLMVKCSQRPNPIPESPAPSPVADTLSDWQMMQMAIIFTESKGDPQALGKTEDRGLYQLTPIYIRDVNRLAGTDYAPEDAYEPLQAIYMFSVVQDHYNPEHDANRAIKLHNPGGAAIGYPQKVKQNLVFIKRMEAVRSALKEYELRKSI